MITPPDPTVRPTPSRYPRAPSDAGGALRMSRATALAWFDGFCAHLPLESIGCGDSACPTLRRDTPGCHDLGAAAQASAMVNRRVPFPSPVPQRSVCSSSASLCFPPSAPLPGAGHGMARPARCSLRTSRAPVWRRLGRRTQRDWRLRGAVPPILGDPGPGRFGPGQIPGRA
jgi:hypothetical protein